MTQYIKRDECKICSICGGPIRRSGATVAGRIVHSDGPCHVKAYADDRDKWMQECRLLRKRLRLIPPRP